uniref:Uncharacterized protein n=1 Tax=Colletotrichum lindemuthianum TaxID=290576 RepID=A0A2D2AJ50_COLLN|nr:hypothetical protein [Colletotrichum lindemuthianum]ATQ37176.1 hypothetical protein [Colletotrichum lindemuthianum]
MMHFNAFGYKNNILFSVTKKPITEWNTCTEIRDLLNHKLGGNNITSVEFKLTYVKNKSSKSRSCISRLFKAYPNLRSTTIYRSHNIKFYGIPQLEVKIFYEGKLLPSDNIVPLFRTITKDDTILESVNRGESTGGIIKDIGCILPRGCSSLNSRGVLKYRGIRTILSTIQTRSFTSSQKRLVNPHNPQDNKGLKVDDSVKKDILEDLKKYDKDNYKPEFENPGYPNCKKLDETVAGQEEYDDLLNRFKDKYSIKKDLDHHNGEAEYHVATKWSQLHPEVPLEAVKAVIKEKQKEDYSNKSTSEDYPDYPVKEAVWREKVDERSFEHGVALPLRKEEQQIVPGAWERKEEIEKREYLDFISQPIAASALSTPSAAESPSEASETEEAPSEAASEEAASKASQTEGEAETNKRPLSSYSDNNPSKKLDSKQSPVDFVLEKQSTEMPDIFDSDGGD